MQDRFKFRAIVKGYYYIDTPEKCKEFEPLIFLENIDVLDIGDIGISEEDLEISIRKQYPDLQDVYIERIMENFRDNSNGIDTYITITPERVYQCTGLKDKNGKLIYEGDVVKCGKWDLAARDSFRDDEYIEQVGVINYYSKRCRFVVNRTTIASLNELILPETCLGILGDCHIEVIGNIYENPELLTKEKVGQ